MSHTPGPWTVKYSLIEDAEGNTVVDCHSSDIEGDSYEANKRLIAAAPELLETLRIIGGAFWTDGEPMEERLANLQQQARDAYAKATGGAE